MQAFVTVPDSERKQWCKDLALHHRSLRKAVHIHDQLSRLMQPIAAAEVDAAAAAPPKAAGSVGRPDAAAGRHGEQEPDEALRRALVAGLFRHPS